MAERDSKFRLMALLSDPFIKEDEDNPQIKLFTGHVDFTEVEIDHCRTDMKADLRQCRSSIQPDKINKIQLITHI